jgi:hypothetical protein
VTAVNEELYYRYYAQRDFEKNIAMSPIITGFL